MSDSSPAPDLSTWAPGFVVGPYVLVRALARGGMGEIWLARQTGAAGFTRLVALKRIIASADDESSFVEMFLDEARIAAHLHHPNIVQVFELGQEGSSWFIAMEYLAGQSLSRVDRRHRQVTGPLPLFLSAEWVAAAARGLGAAHRALSPDGQPLQIVHRDVSPQNLFVTWDGHVKVLDFGIARSVGRLARTRTGIAKGKIAYMSPEQAIAAEVNAASDVYSLGIVLAELITGERFYGELDDLQILGLLSRRERPSQSLAHLIDPTLDTLVHRALAPQAVDRFQDGAELADALEAWLRRQAFEDGRVSGRELMHRLFASEIEAAKTPQASHPSLSSVPLKLLNPVPAAATAPSASSTRPRARLFVAGAIAAACGVALTMAVQFVARPQAVPQPIAPAASPATVDASVTQAEAAPPAPLAPVVVEPARTPAVSEPKRPANPERVRRGRLTLDTQPWTMVFEGKRQLGMTPLVELPLSAGRHRLRLVNAEERIDSVVEVDVPADGFAVKKFAF